jgi:hypothetical protein
MKKSSKKRFFILKKNQNEDLKIHKGHLNIQIDFSKSHIYKDVLKRFKLEAHELGYGKKMLISNMI